MLSNEYKTAMIESLTIEEIKNFDCNNITCEKCLFYNQYKLELCLVEILQNFFK